MEDSVQQRQNNPVDFDLVDTLTEDVTRTLATLRKPFDQPTLRSAFRATFAAVEGITYYLKQEALRDPDKHTAEELVLLREENYSITYSGEVSISRRRLPSSYNFLFAARMALRPLLPRIKIDSNDLGRLAFERAIQVRHRITHPKELRDLQIADDEVLSLVEGFHWCYGLLTHFEQAVLDLLEEGLAAIDHAKQQLDQIAQRHVVQKAGSKQGEPGKEV